MMRTLLSQSVVKTVPLNGADIEQTRNNILHYFREAVTVEDTLYSGITDSLGFYKRADELRHPLIFYYGHTASFFVNKFLASGIITERINPLFESLFAIGVDEMSWDDLDSKHYDWPPLGDVQNYRKKVFGMVEKIILEENFSLPIDWDSRMWIVLMGIEHLRIHIETSSVLIRQLPLDYLSIVQFWKNAPSNGFPPVNQLIEIDGAEITLGKPLDYPTYGWDNEYGISNEMVTSMKVSKYLCSNSEYLSFVIDKGYSTQEYWSQEGWEWVKYKHCMAPRFWEMHHNHWKLRTIFELIDMPWDWPVEVNCLEAEAFCRWKSKKESKNYALPSEAQWESIYRQGQIEDLYQWPIALGNINLEHYHSPCPINTFAFGNIYDVIGNVWQWTQTPIDGYKGFRVHPIYDDFSVPTFDHKHNLIKGGSWISTGNEASRYARYAFRRHFYQHAGFRYILSDYQQERGGETVVYDKEVVEKLLCEWTPSQNYKEKVITDICCHLFEDPTSVKTMDVGCSTGRSTFELMRYFHNIHGVDRSARHIGCGVMMKEQKHILFWDQEQKQIVLNDFLDIDIPEKAAFYQTDFANMKPFFSDYQLVVVRRYDNDISYKEWLRILSSRMVVNGYLVFVNPPEEFHSIDVAEMSQWEFVETKEEIDADLTISIWKKI